MRKSRLCNVVVFAICAGMIGIVTKASFAQPGDKDIDRPTEETGVALPSGQYKKYHVKKNATLTLHGTTRLHGPTVNQLAGELEIDDGGALVLDGELDMEHGARLTLHGNSKLTINHSGTLVWSEPDISNGTKAGNGTMSRSTIENHGKINVRRANAQAPEHGLVIRNQSDGIIEFGDYDEPADTGGVCQIDGDIDNEGEIILNDRWAWTVAGPGRKPGAIGGAKKGTLTVPDPALFSITGSLTVSSGKFTENINMSTGHYGQLSVAGTVTINGATLAVNLTGTPIVGQFFPIIDADTVNGAGFGAYPPATLWGHSVCNVTVPYAGQDYFLFYKTAGHCPP